MLVLGVVHLHGQAHGYQVRRELLTWRADVWARLNPGSIYQALRTCTKNGLLEPVATEAAGGPERTVYRLTPDGETELLHLVRVAVSDPAWGTGAAESLNAAFAFLHLLTRREVADLLAYRARALVARRASFVATDANDGTPPQVEALNRLHADQIGVAIGWSEDLRQKILAGAYTFAGDAEATSQA
jgi:DNA-binding PadR family transcriptional regulator